MNTKCKLSDNAVLIASRFSEQSREQQEEDGVKKVERSVHTAQHIRSKAHWSEVSIPTLQRPVSTQGSKFDPAYSGTNSAPSIEHKQSLLDNVLTQNFSQRETARESNDGRRKSDLQTMFQEYKLPEELGNIKINKTGQQLGQRESVVTAEGEVYYNPVWNKRSHIVHTFIPGGKKSNSIKIPESVWIEQDDSELFGSFCRTTERKPQRNINHSIDLEFYDINSDAELNSKINRRRAKSLNDYEVELVTPKSSVDVGGNKYDLPPGNTAVLQEKEYRTPGAMRSWQSAIFDKRDREMLEKDYITEREFERNYHLVKKKDSLSEGERNWDEETDGENVRRNRFITKDVSVKHNEGRIEYDHAVGCRHNFRNGKQDFHANINTTGKCRDDRNSEPVFFGKTCTEENIIRRSSYDKQNMKNYPLSYQTFSKPITQDRTISNPLHNDNISNEKDSRNPFDLPSCLSQESERRTSYSSDSSLLTKDSHEEESDVLTGIQSKEEFKTNLKQLSRYVSPSYKMTAGAVTSEMNKKVYHLDEEEGELSEVKEEEQEFKKLSMIVNVISRLREMYAVNSFVKSSSNHSLKTPEVSGNYGFENDEANKLLRDALESGRISEVKNVVLNNLNIDINLRSQSGCSSLHKTAENGDIEGLRFLIEHHADLNVGDRSGFPPVHHALQRYHYKAAIFLMDRGTNLMRYTSRRIEQFLKVKATAKQYLRQNLKTTL